MSSTANGWPGTVSGESSLQTSLTVGCGDEDLYIANACMELMVDGSAECNEAVGGRIHVPESRRELTGTCTINSVTRTSVPLRKLVTILSAGGSAEDIWRAALTVRIGTGEDGVDVRVVAHDAPQGFAPVAVSLEGRGLCSGARVRVAIAGSGAAGARVHLWAWEALRSR